MHVFFDLDGTLTDSQEGIIRCMAHALQVMGRRPPDPPELTRFIGVPLAQGFETLLGTSDPSLVQEAVGLYRERFDRRGLYENRVYPGIPAALSALQSPGRSLWIVTVKPQPFAQRIADHFGLVSYFRGIHGTQLDGGRTGKADLIRSLLACEGIAPGGAVMVGDREEDVRGAREAGVGAVAVLWGYGSREELERAQPDALVESVEQLVERLRPRGG